jgi:hypothetical protein
MEDNVFILPGDEAELVELYLDKEKHEVLLDKHSLFKKALAARLEAGLVIGVPETDALTTHELADRCRELSRQVFASAIADFAKRLCGEQRAICSHKFMVAPVGYEQSWIDDAPMPCVIERKQHKILRDFRESLDAGKMKELMNDFPDIFGGGDTRESFDDFAIRREQDLEDDDTVIDFCTERWDELSVEDKFRIYNHLSTVPEQPTNSQTTSKL